MYYVATFQPKNEKISNLEVEEFRGKKLFLYKGWQAAEGHCFGQQCYITSPYIGWIPECDLKDMKQISYSEWEWEKSILENR